MAVWTPGDPPPPPLSFITTSTRIPDDVAWIQDRYLDVVPRGCNAAHSGEHVCSTPPPQDDQPEDYLDGTCEDCELPLCLDRVPDHIRFHAFPMHSRLCGCEVEDGRDYLGQVRSTLNNGHSSLLARRFFRQLDENLDPSFNVTPNGPTCAERALAGVLQGRGMLGLSVGGLASDIGTAFELVKEGLGVFTNNGVALAGGLQLTTDYGMPKDGGANLTGVGGGWIAALHSRPAHGVSSDILPTTGNVNQPAFYDGDTGCYVPAAKKWGIAAHDAGCVTFAEVDLGCD